MSDVVRYREAVSAMPDDAELAARARAGWRLVAVEWERDAVAEAGKSEAIEIPFGLKVSADCRHLEEDPQEMEVLVTGMELMISEAPFSRIADELNRRGFRRRDGTAWSPISIFNLLPRLIEIGPRIFPSDDWVERRKRIYARIGALL
jgi:hypothetical protein